jgi:membrane associated rhomboid family serine protease
MATCYRHPSRETGVSCSSCGRPICPDCMTPTPVGMRCPDCARQRTRVQRLRPGASVSRLPVPFGWPPVTFGLIAINVLVFLAEKGQFTVYGSGARGTLVTEGVIARVLQENTLEGLVTRMPIAHEHQYWRLVTNAFLHENIVHIGFNMYLLYLLGMMLEPAIGSLRFATIYFTSLLAGSLGVLVATPDPSLGASGAIFGLMGAAVVELRARHIGVMESGIGFLIVINLVISFTVPGISVGAHVGGLVGGFLAAMAIRAADERRASALGFAACLVLCAAAVAGAIAVAGSTSAGIAL